MEGMSILSFDGAPGSQAKRRKALRACNRCRSLKKSCNPMTACSACDRCDRDSAVCSFENGLISPVSRAQDGIEETAQFREGSGTSNGGVTNLLELEDDTSRTTSTKESGLSGHNGARVTPASISNTPPNASSTERPQNNEARYSTMLDLVLSNSHFPLREPTGVKLIGDTNPLSALLRKDLKHKIVTSLCAFRSPEPVLDSHVGGVTRSSGARGWQWKQAYAQSGINPVKMRYITDMGCFDLPGPELSGELLDKFFTRVHPLLPVIDRQEFLARYYGIQDPPPLVLVLAIFMAASRYSKAYGRGDESNSSIRELCDRLHTKFRAVVEVGVMHERLAVVQAYLLASLHWEGREGVNSALDSLSLAVRMGQELGLHRRTERIDSSADKRIAQVHKRVWWCIYAMDRFNAAQEGTALLVNELDCDIDALVEEDFENEDEITCYTTLSNVSLSMVVEEAIRNLYSIRTRKLDYVSQSMLDCRDRLNKTLNQLSQDINSNLLRTVPSGKDSIGDDIRQLWASLLQINIDAVHILIQRPFLLHLEPSEDPLRPWFSRELSRDHAMGICVRLLELQNHGLLGYAWPFTIYATVSAMLIFWYDLAAPSGVLEAHVITARKNFASIVELLQAMGDTWWAAAAKHKLGEALLRLLGGIGSYRGRISQVVESHPPLELGSSWSTHPHSVLNTNGQIALPSDPGLTGAANGSNGNYLPYDENLAFWSSIGLDFENDVAAGVYGIM
ncbi:hypothetical protein O988_04258 [Pseudogymnoascus sp. VKM F-3808]|nr:hypothetical protein O988_04258 [Pseudogymnoascus sp. VKM F-3808]